MGTNIFVNLPVADLPRSVEFFERLGYEFNDQFTDETGAAMQISTHIYAILLTHDKFSQFTSKKIVDGHESTEMIVALTADSRNAVDELMATALSNGAVEANRAVDQGWMYGRAFHDLDGHIWETVWLDQSYLS